LTSVFLSQTSVAPRRMVSSITFCETTTIITIVIIIIKRVCYIHNI
jgi:hypothetical protein